MKTIALPSSMGILVHAVALFPEASVDDRLSELDEALQDLRTGFVELDVRMAKLTTSIEEIGRAGSAAHADAQRAPGGFPALVSSLVTAGMPRSRAICKVIDVRPELHLAWLAAGAQPTL